MDPNEFHPGCVSSSPNAAAARHLMSPSKIVLDVPLWCRPPPPPSSQTSQASLSVRLAGRHSSLPFSNFAQRHSLPPCDIFATRTWPALLLAIIIPFGAALVRSRQPPLLPLRRFLPCAGPFRSTAHFARSQLIPAVPALPRQANNKLLSPRAQTQTGSSACLRNVAHSLQPQYRFQDEQGRYQGIAVQGPPFRTTGEPISCPRLDCCLLAHTHTAGLLFALRPLSKGHLDPGQEHLVKKFRQQVCSLAAGL